MTRRRVFTATLVAAIWALAGSAIHPAHAQDRPTLVFTAIPDQDETRLVERFTKVADYLQAKLGSPVRYLPVKSYPAAVTAFINNQVQLAWFGGFTGVQARRQVPGSEAIAQGTEDVAFKSFVIANVSTGLRRSPEFPKAIAGRSFTFGARASTSGRLMPDYFFRQEFDGRPPEEVFSRVGFSGDHSRTIQLVQSGAFEVGVLDYTVWGVETKAGKVDGSRVEVIWETPTYPDYQWTIRGDIDTAHGDGFREKVRDALLAIDDPTILGYFARSKFIPTTNQAYAPIEEVAKATGLLD